MKCPQCNEEMKKGYIHSSRPIYWSEGKETAVIGGDEILVGAPMFKMKKLAGYRCEECKVVTFKYDK